MLRIVKKLEHAESLQPQLILALPFEMRQRSRFKTTLSDGREAGLFLPRGTVLRQGDRLESEDGMVVEVMAKLESVSNVATKDPLLMARACYHLGNRHVPLQINEGRIRYLSDHVLDDMVRGLGLTVYYEMAPFEPESGAYAGHHHGHG